MTPIWYVESMDLGKVDGIYVAVEFCSLFRLLIPHVADPFKEQQGQDVCLPVRAIHGATTQDLGAIPEMGLQLSQ